MVFHRCSNIKVFWLLAWLVTIITNNVCALSLSSSSSFHGRSLVLFPTSSSSSQANAASSNSHRAQLFMRKQKASDKRTRRRQRGEILLEEESSLTASLASSVTVSPMKEQGPWKQKTAVRSALQNKDMREGRGRSRKRSLLYTSLSFYHDKFMHLLQAEYKAEEDEVLGRIKASLDNPVSLEVAGYALLDMEASRRGNLFSDEVYRLTKAHDATTLYSSDHGSRSQKKSKLPPSHKFRPNDVMLLTLQPNGSGDYFDATTTSPLSEEATHLEARVLNVGPTYVDIAIQAGKFASTLGPAPNEEGGGHRRYFQRLRVDRFFSNIPYQRMVTALKQLSKIPDRGSENTNNEEENDTTSQNPLSRIRMDSILSHVILSSHAFADAESPLLSDPTVCDMDELARLIGRPPMPTSSKLAQQVLRYMVDHPNKFRPLNGPQLAAVEAALTRRLTMIQGPPGTGKTTVAASIGFGMVHQCRTISADSAKVLACAFSNVGADNLAQALKNLGLEVIRIGKPTAVMESLWNNTLDAAIDRDPDARQALDAAAKATAKLGKIQEMDKTEERLVRQAATRAVKEAQAACLVAATRAMRKADVIVSTSTGAADPRLMAACGIQTGEDQESETSKRALDKSSAIKSANDRTNAPDGLPPLSLPFVIVDEACQSVEPATLVPLVSSDTCRSLVLLGDPCQLPPTVRSSEDSDSPLSVSLMERLAGVLPAPHVRSQEDLSPKDTSYLGSLAVKQCRSLLHALEKKEDQELKQVSYRKRFEGSILLSIQYRMHPSIAAFPSAIFYDGLLATPDFMKDIREFPDSLQSILPPAQDKTLGVRVINVGGRNNERRGSLSSLTQTNFGASNEGIEQQTSFLNDLEAEYVINLLEDIVGSDDASVQSVGIISPYAAQVQLIQSLISENAELQKRLSSSKVELEIKSVDGYQGRERDVIIFSAVRSNRKDNIGFLRDWRRMNVALTRAKAALVVVGDFETLSDGDKNWAAFYKWALGAGCLVEVDSEAVREQR